MLYIFLCKNIEQHITLPEYYQWLSMKILRS